MIALGSDHAGVLLKQKLIAYLKSRHIECCDLGAYTVDRTDYPKYAKLVAQSVLSGQSEKGVLVCGTGVGISMAANKIHGIRCALCTDTFMARMARAHNDANILALGARVTGEGSALEILDVFLATEFDGGRHTERLKMVTEMENERND